MPTLAARNSPAPAIVVTTAATATATAGAVEMTTISSDSNNDSGGGTGAGIGVDSTATTTTVTAATASNVTTTSTTVTNSSNANALRLGNHHYLHPPPPLPYATVNADGNVGGGVVGSGTMSLTTAAVSGTASNVSGASLAAPLNGNSNLNVANGNIGGNGNGNSNGNSNINGGAPITHSNSNNNGVTINNNIHNNDKKTLALQSSREDVVSASLSPTAAAAVATTLPISNHQLTAASHGNSNSNNNSAVNNLPVISHNNSSGGSGSGNGNGNNCNSNSSILKGSKENLLQNCYNGSGGDPGACIAPPMHSSENDDPGDGLGPLPPKWETAYTERGELYFIDHNTGTSHWLDPRLSKFQKKSLEDCSDDELPYGWEKIEDSLYGTYYIDHVNRRTQYENPVLEAKRRAAEQKQKQIPPLQSSPQTVMQQQHSVQRPQTPSSQHLTLLGGGSSNITGLNGSRSGINAITNSSSCGNVLDIAQHGMPALPTVMGLQSQPAALLPYKFTRNPAEMQGERITATLVKSARGLGITIVGGDDAAEEFLQIKSIVPHGPAWLDGQLQTGDVLIYVNDTCVLGFTHLEMVNVFQSILPGETVTLEVCRGYPLPFDPNDPNTEVVTTVAVDGISVAASDKQRRMLLDLHMDGNYNFLDVSGQERNGQGQSHLRNQHSPGADGGSGGGVGGVVGGGGGIGDGGLNDGFILMKKNELIHTFAIVKGAMGFGFTIADSAYGQKVKKILDHNCCTQLQEGDVLMEINNVNVRQKSHLEVVQILKDCSKTEPTIVKIQRGAPASTATSPSGGIYNSTTVNSNTNTSGLGNVAKLRKNFIGNTVLFRSKTPTADLYSTQQKEILPIRPKTPLVDTRRARVRTPNNELQEDDEIAVVTSLNGENTLSTDKKSQVDGSHKSTNSLQEIDVINQDIPPFMDPYPKLVTSLSERLAEATLLTDTLCPATVGNNVVVDDGSGGAVGSMRISHQYHQNNTPSLRPTAHYDHQEYVTAGARSANAIYGMSPLPPSMSSLYPHAPAQHLSHLSNAGYSPSAPLSLMTSPSPHMMHHHLHPVAPQYSPASLHVTTPLQAAHIQNERMQKRVNELLSDRRRVGFPTLDMQQSQHQQSQQYPPQPQQLKQQSQFSHTNNFLGYQQQQAQHQQQLQHHMQHSPAVNSISQQVPISWLSGGVATGNSYNTQPVVPINVSYMPQNGMDTVDDVDQYELSEVTLERQALGFGFRIVGGTEEGSQVTVGHIVPGGAADNDHRINTGDEILSIDGINVVNSSHHKVVSLMGEAALRGQVTMILRRRSRQPHQEILQQSPRLGLPVRPALRYPYDVIVSRHEAEGFGFVIISSSNQYYGSTIGKLIPGSPADRCGELKVGDRIIAVNRIDIAGMSHGDVVNLIKESGLHVRLTIGCPKETVSGVTGPALLINSAQVSPGQISQTQLMYAPLAQPSNPPLLTTPPPPPPLQQQQQQQQQQKQRISPLTSSESTGTYFDRSPAGATSIMTQQQQPQQQPQL